MMKSFSLRVLLLAVIAVVAASLASQPVTALEAKPGARQKATGLPGLLCKNGGRDVRLAAANIKKQHRAYIEFRTRHYPGSLTGHMFVVFGELDARSKVVSRYHIGLVPKVPVAGFFGGSLVPVPSSVLPTYSDCNSQSRGAWRLSVSNSQYEAIKRRAKASLANPPLWSMFGYNCNHFAAGFGDILGLKRPKGNGLPAFSYLPAYIAANASKHEIAKYDPANTASR